MKNIEALSQQYMILVIEELESRGLSENQIQIVIEKARYKDCLKQFPEESIHYPVEATADEILQAAAVS